MTDVLFQLSVHHLKIIAVDAGVPALTSSVDVTVELLDVNDSPPQFSNSNFTATLQVGQHDNIMQSVPCWLNNTNHY